MNKVGVLAAIYASLLMSGCTGATYDCADKAVQETVLDAFNDVARDSYAFRGQYHWPFVNEPEYLELADQTSRQISMNNIITVQKNDDIGAYECSATFSTTTKSKTFSDELEYGVRKVESGDAPFSIVYNRLEFVKVASVAINEITGPYAEKRIAQHKAEAKAEQDAAMQANPPIPLTEESVRNHLFYSEEDPASAQIIQADINGDMLPDFVAMRRQFAGMNENNQKAYLFSALCLTQTAATEPGAENSYRVVNQGIPKVLGETVNMEYSADPMPQLMFDSASKVATVRTSDGRAYELSCVATN